MDIKGKKIFLYMNFFKDDDSIGITKKIKAQIKTLRRMGMDVTYTSYTDSGAVIIDNEEKVIYSKEYKIKNSFYKRFKRRFLLIDTVNEYLKLKKTKYDFAYLRWHTYDSVFIEMLDNLKKCGAKNIIEAHAWTPDRKGKTLIAKYQIYMDNKNSSKAKSRVDLVAAMCEYDNIWGIKTVKVDNAVDLESISKRNHIKNEKELRIISVSNEYPYHGYDRLLNGLKNYYDKGGKVDIKVHFIGVFMESTKKLAMELGLSKRVYFHGKMHGEALDKVYDNSDLGIGALAHHRVGMYSGSSLKTKEYFAKGLPFIYGWKEPAFDETYPYALQIPLCEEPIDVEEIIDFYNGIKDDDNMINNMREFAKENYSWEKEFKKVFEQFQD